MKATRIIRSLGPIDFKSIHRDSMMRWMVFIPVMAAVVLRFGAPVLAAFLLDRFAFDVAPYYPLLMSFIAVAMPMMYGAIIGFLVLDQRDDHTITALQVTPLTLSGYLAYRVAMPTVLGVFVTMFVVPASGLVQMNPLALLVAAVAGSLFAPLSALFLAAFASNKVQGFALMKGAGVIFLPVIMAYFVEEPLQFIFGLVPVYWPVKLFWALQAGQPFSWFYLFMSVVYQGGLIWLLLKRFNQTMHRA